MSTGITLAYIPKFIKKTTPKAQGACRCDGCGKIIQKGERYKYISGKFGVHADGNDKPHKYEMLTFKMHMGCNYIQDKEEYDRDDDYTVFKCYQFDCK